MRYPRYFIAKDPNFWRSLLYYKVEDEETILCFHKNPRSFRHGKASENYFYVKELEHHSYLREVCESELVLLI